MDGGNLVAVGLAALDELTRVAKEGGNLLANRRQLFCGHQCVVCHESLFFNGWSWKERAVIRFTTDISIILQFTADAVTPDRPPLALKFGQQPSAGILDAGLSV